MALVIHFEAFGDAAHRNPQCAARLQRAAVILEVGDLKIELVAWEKCQQVHWRISSQSNAGAYVVAGHGLHCPCQDARTKAPKVGSVNWCKHAIAIASYLKILRCHFNADVRSGAIDLGVLGNGTLGAYAKGLGIVTVAKVGGSETYSFVDHASAIRYSMWLAKHSATTDTRVVELEELAREEGIKLPMAADMIAFFESQGYVVDLQTGEAIKNVSVDLSPHHKALSHLYGLAA